MVVDLAGQKKSENEEKAHVFMGKILNEDKMNTKSRGSSKSIRAKDDARKRGKAIAAPLKVKTLSESDSSNKTTRTVYLKNNIAIAKINLEKETQQSSNKFFLSETKSKHTRNKSQQISSNQS